MMDNIGHISIDWIESVVEGERMGAYWYSDTMLKALKRTNGYVPRCVVVWLFDQPSSLRVLGRDRVIVV